MTALIVARRTAIGLNGAVTLLVLASFALLFRMSPSLDHVAYQGGMLAYVAFNFRALWAIDRLSPATSCSTLCCSG